VSVQPSDLTAKARIRNAALELFARDGVQGTSMRSVASKARVSPSLVVHHFGTKTKLRAAVDDAVLSEFERALADIDLARSPIDVSDQVNAAIAGIIGGDRAVREYLGRSLVEASPVSQQLFDALVELITSGIDQLKQSGHVNRNADTTWSAYAVLFIVLGPILLNRQLETRLDTDPFAPEIVAARSSTNIRILQSGLFAK
jgi:TetR/AcrR family transcriptional regulator, regulator of cefoperazone and chloramphenicol sensitivity